MKQYKLLRPLFSDKEVIWVTIQTTSGLYLHCLPLTNLCGDNITFKHYTTMHVTNLKVMYIRKCTGVKDYNNFSNQLYLPQVVEVDYPYHEQVSKLPRWIC